MDWIQFIMLVGSMSGLTWYTHRETLREMKELRGDMNTEMKDFHGRLCTIEERYLQMMQRFLERK